MRKEKNWQWSVNQRTDGNYDIDQVHLSVLMDIRDELQRLNGIMGCQNAIRIPRILDRIAANTTKPKRKRIARKVTA